jgi:protein-S-isoprenylcysteine O-methyltransferase Ste14
MLIIYLAVVGVLVFVLGTAILGSWLRKHASKTNAERSSRIMHFLYFVGLVTPAIILMIYPGLTHVDGLVGLRPLPLRPLFFAAGIVLALPGLYFLALSNRLLRVSGNGANAFRLTRHVVEVDIYTYTRNPMSLGYYLFSIGVSLASGSTFATLGVLLGVIPAHVFFLKFFEERELELRFSEPYRHYKRNTPFLIPRLPAH